MPHGQERLKMKKPLPITNALGIDTRPFMNSSTLAA
jgi:hypothetical protein